MDDINPQKSDFLLYNSPDGGVSMEVFVHNDTVWLTQGKMAELFGKSQSTISEHISNIYEEGELEKGLTLAKFGNSENSLTKPNYYYNLDVIISVGYRVNSKEATSFRKWATSVLRSYIIKGFALDDELLKNGSRLGKDYFKELLERVRSIRASERRIYQKITDIFAECSIDYDQDSDITKSFYAMVQNKFHYAITGKTAAEIVYSGADKNKPNMGLTTWKKSPNGRILKSDVTVAKNYLEENEIKRLERTVSGFFDYIENVIENKRLLKMQDLADSVDKFLSFNEYKILDGKGQISHKKAEQKAFTEYDEFNKTQKIESDFDKEVKKMLKEGE